MLHIIDLDALGGKKLFKISLESRLRVRLNPTWIRDSTKTYFLKKNSWKKVFFFIPEEINAQKQNSILVQEELNLVQEKIKVQEEEKHIMVQEESKEENEKEVESKLALEVELTIIS